ncbi:hypothetical protein JCM19235_1626 [Vibrio maritimus]|uniref:Uncharacterized protein n=1 Tax=Vibrio maritimus TaxID=990268 RepID=A0A090S5K8_9VIBR|nr:hypothetical protein JCM19235_1626 [Vibrio maritimus]
MKRTKTTHKFPADNEQLMVFLCSKKIYVRAHSSINYYLDLQKEAARHFGVDLMGDYTSKNPLSQSQRSSKKNNKAKSSPTVRGLAMFITKILNELSIDDHNTGMVHNLMTSLKQISLNTGAQQQNNKDYRTAKAELSTEISYCTSTEELLVLVSSCVNQGLAYIDKQLKTHKRVLDKQALKFFAKLKAYDRDLLTAYLSIVICEHFYPSFGSDFMSK